MLNRRDAGHEMWNAGQVGCRLRRRIGGMHERRNAGNEGCKTEGLKERRDAGKERFKR